MSVQLSSHNAILFLLLPGSDLQAELVVFQVHILMNQ